MLMISKDIVARVVHVKICLIDWWSNQGTNLVDRDSRSTSQLHHYNPPSKKKGGGVKLQHEHEH